MGSGAAGQDDLIRAMDQHQVQPTGGGPAASVPLPFAGRLDGGLSANVKVMGRAAAMEGSTATNDPRHQAPGGTVFVKEPSNRGTIQSGSATVKINGKAAARDGDPAMTCNDPADRAEGRVEVAGKPTVLIG